MKITRSHSRLYLSYLEEERLETERSKLDCISLFSMYLCVSYTLNGFINQTETAIRPLQIFSCVFLFTQTRNNPKFSKHS